MAKKVKDTEYLMLSSMLRAREAGMLTRERMDRMLSAPSYQEAAKLLCDCGYEDMSACSLEGVNDALTRRRSEVFAEMAKMSPHSEVVDIFRVKYDYHNLKALVKAKAMGVDAGHILSECGRVEAGKLAQCVSEEGGLSSLPQDMAEAYTEAVSVLTRTGNPPLADFELDRRYFALIGELAAENGSKFLAGYVEVLIDSANLRAAVRTVRMGKDRAFMLSAMAPGGSVDPEVLARAAENGESLAACFNASGLEKAAHLGAEAMKGGAMTAFELECDNAVSAYLAGAKMIPFGVEPVAEYLALVESEITAARMILTGRLGGIEPEVIRERLRDINA